MSRSCYPWQEPSGNEENHSQLHEKPPWMMGGSMLLGFVIMMIFEALAKSQGHQCSKLGEDLGSTRKGKVRAGMRLVD